MKKLIAVVLTLALLVSLSACASTAATTAAAADTAAATSEAETQKASGLDIGFCVPDTTNPFVGWLTQEVKKQAEADGLTIQIADAANSSAKQIEQIENFLAMNVKALDIMPVDPNAMPDIIQKAQAQGVKVLVAGTDTGVYDVMMNMDQYNCGEQIAEMGIEWILKTFTTDGKPESLTFKPKVLVIKYTQTNDSNNRSTGIIDKITNWGYADVVVSQTESITAAQATDVLQNMWQQNSDAVLVMTYNADSAMGANEYIMGLQGVDFSKVAVFSGDSSEPIIETINRSTANESVFRGTMGIIGPQINGEQIDLPVATYNALKGLAEGKLVYGNKITDAIAKIYPQ